MSARRGVRLHIPKILEVLPHRYPFVMVDRVTDLVPGEHIKGHKCVSANEPWCQGHFPGQPVLPGTLIVEALSQLSAILAYASEPFDVSRSVMYFLGFDKVKFRNTVAPGDRLDLRVEVAQHRTNTWKFSAEATVDGLLAASAELVASIVDR
jgi:3-hydroxyacyl-[acyl-carrier-protein] dehydratase